jgi:elongation factor G
MKVYATPDIRSAALLGHGGSGKTSLTSALLFASGNLNRLGKVEDGTAPTDFDEEEIERGISLQTALAHVEWKSTKLNLIDTPGYAAFLADGKVALAATDLAVILVEAVSGVQVITERTFGYAGERELPVMFVMSKLDRENASFDRTLESIQSRFGREAVPVQVPIGKEHDFEGVIDLISGKALRFAKDGSGKMTEEALPADLEERATSMRSALVEMVAENDESLMETFFEAGDLTEEQLNTGLRNAVTKRKIFPVFCTAATRLIGIQPFMDALVQIGPPPGARGEAAGTLPGTEEEVRRPVTPDQPVSLFVFKTIADPFAGRLSLFRVCSGTLKAESSVINVSRGNQAERLGALSVMQGKQMTVVKELQAGDLGVVAKLKETHTSDTLADPAKPILYPPVNFREPAISYAVEPKSKGDEEKISSSLARMMEEDPVLRVNRDPQTGELLVSGTGQVHVEVALSRMKRKFGVEAILHRPRVPYLETIKKKVSDVEGKHKKQTGGRGQFGVCVINVEPLPRGSGFEFVDKIFGGSIPQNYRPAVEKGIREAAARGWLSDSPVVDFRVTLIDGKYHTVDSSEMAFKIAGSLAFRGAMERAQPTILEPIMSVEITIPEECMGDVMGDLSSRRGKPQGMDAQGVYQLIKAQVPMSEMLEYASTLKSVTSDRGSYQMEFSHYEEVPGSIREKIIAEAQKRREERAG